MEATMIRMIHSPDGEAIKAIPFRLPVLSHKSNSWPKSVLGRGPWGGSELTRAVVVVALDHRTND
jgi:hypothetical protein